VIWRIVLNESTSDFGLANGNASAVTNKQVQIYIVQRAATFFQYLVNASFPSTLRHTKFVDCLNTRFGCNSDSGTTCSETATCNSSRISSTNVQQKLPAKKEINSLFTATEINKTIYLKFYKPGNSKILLFTINGIPVKNLQTSNSEVVLAGTDLSSDVYLLKVIQGTQTQVLK
jgi:hypothetical protein